MFSVSVIIPTYKRPCQLSRVLLILAIQEFTDFEVIVVDDSPDSQTMEAIANLNIKPVNLTYIKRSDLGFRVASARNDAISLARSEVLIGIQDATEPGPTLIQEHFQAVIGSNIFSIGAVRNNKDDPYSDDRELLKLLDYNNLWKHAWGRNFALSTSKAKEIKFDEDFDGAYGFEDVAFGLSCERAGLKLIWNREAWCYQLSRKQPEGQRHQDKQLEKLVLKYGVWP